jgi:Sulfotransferase family
MNSSSLATNDSPNLVDGEALLRAKPVLFVHIPKTAGGSFLMVPRNVFGDHRVRRLRGGADETTQTEIDRVVSDEIQDIDCLAAHSPIHMFAKYLDSFRPFTILRDPVDRVMSLFRFFKSRPYSEIKEQTKLPHGFGFDDFIGSRVPHNYWQTHNSMCRFLCGDAEMSDDKAVAFWQPRDPGALVDQALATLRTIDFGLVEDLQSTLALLQHAWAIKFNLGEYRFNPTGAPGAEWTARNIQRIVELNTLDVALYHEARTLFYTRVRNVSAARRMSVDGIPSLPMLRVQPGQEISVNDIPGRQGFHEFEQEAGFAWLAANQTVLIGFLAPPKMLRLQMTFYCVTDHFPAEEIKVTLNGTRLTHRVAPIEGNWVSLETEAFRPNEKLNVLTLSPPYVIPVRFLHPASKDDRYLSVALAKLVFVE